jgi:tRNA(His) 5'-end guanylyltransferase
VLGYTQSDEITLILVDYQTLTTEAWFDYRVEKLCSVPASMATMAFNKFLNKNVVNYTFSIAGEEARYGKTEWTYEDEYLKTLMKAVDKGAIFDARCFNIPKEEVTNLIYWRQLDASCNSVQMVGQAYFSQKELQDKSCSDIQDMLMTKGVNWNDLPTYQKRGSCCVKNKIVIESNGITADVYLRDTSKSANKWIIDTNIPIFKGEGREYIGKLVYVGD